MPRKEVVSLPKYVVKVEVKYPVSAINAEDALSTVPRVIRMNFIGGIAEGLTEIVDAGTGEVVLKAVLNPDIKKEANGEKMPQMRDSDDAG